jgi:hypothetical protein
MPKLRNKEQAIKLLGIIRATGGRENRSKANPQLYAAIFGGITPRNIQDILIDLLTNKLIEYKEEKGTVIYSVIEKGFELLPNRQKLITYYNKFSDLEEQYKGKENKVKGKEKMAKKKIEVSTIETEEKSSKYDHMKKKKKASKKAVAKKPATKKVASKKEAPKKATTKRTTTKNTHEKAATKKGRKPTTYDSDAIPAREGTKKYQIWKELDNMRKRRKNLASTAEIMEKLGTKYGAGSVSVTLMAWRKHNGLKPERQRRSKQ